MCGAMTLLLCDRCGDMVNGFARSSLDHYWACETCMSAFDVWLNAPGRLKDVVRVQAGDIVEQVRQLTAWDD